MNRVARNGVLSVFGLILGLLISAGTALVPAAALAGPKTDVQDFEFDSYSADYYLSRDAGNYSVLRTVETFVAVFPNFDQNRGIIRAIPNYYDGVPLATSVESVTDGSGNSIPYSQTTGEYTELKIGSGEYVHGRMTYTIAYTQRNVVRAFSDTNDDEFYWDANGTGFPQPFDRVDVRVHLDPALDSILTGTASCYFGPEGSTSQCEISKGTDAEGTVFSASARGLDAFETLTVAIGFNYGSFAQVEPVEVPGSSDGFDGVPFSMPNAPDWPIWVSIGLGILTMLGIAFTIVWRFVKPAGAKGRGIIIPQYTPPKDMNLLEASNLIGRTWKGVPAQIVSLAVRGNLRILDYPITKSGAKFTLQLLSLDKVDADELALLKAIFGGLATPDLSVLRQSGFVSNSVMELITSAIGSEYSEDGLPPIGATQEVGVTDDTAAQAIAEVRDAVRKRVLQEGLIQKRSPAVGLIAAASCFVASLVGMGMFVVSMAFLSVNLWGIAVFVIGLLGSFICAGFAWRPATVSAAGADKRDYLIGMRDYLQLAEADRLNMLQSPEGAERVRAEGVNPKIPAERVKLYEKLLPFAVLWGIENQWAKELAIYYEQNAPEWYSGSGSFDFGAFSSTLGVLSVSSIANRTVSSSSSSSSSWSGSSGGSFSGGSSGGGFSGGGGGGGGGGGW